MKHMLNINPFDEFWFSCETNNKVSILSSVEPSYKYAMYSNDYIYNSEYSSFNKKFIAISYFKNRDFSDISSYIKETGYNYKNVKNIINEIRELLSSNKIVLPLVDLYCWNKSNYFYKREHTWHYTLLVGYDDLKKEFFALEDDIFANYGVITESEDALYTAIIGSIRETNEPSEVPEYLILSVPESLPKFSLLVDDVLKNIQTIKNSLNSVQLDDLFEFNCSSEGVADFFKWQPLLIRKIINRQIANSLLFDKLSKLKIISCDSNKKITDDIKCIIDDWTVIQGIIAKGSHMDINSFANRYSGKTLELVKHTLGRELDVWIYAENLISMNSSIMKFDLASK